MMMIWHAMCQQSVTTNSQPHDSSIMTYYINFNTITFINWSKVFIMSKHVFYNLFYAITMSNKIKKTITIAQD
jgi:hypothetical protein